MWISFSSKYQVVRNIYCRLSMENIGYNDQLYSGTRQSVNSHSWQLLSDCYIAWTLPHVHYPESFIRTFCSHGHFNGNACVWISMFYCTPKYMIKTEPILVYWKFNFFKMWKTLTFFNENWKSDIFRSLATNLKFVLWSTCRRWTKPDHEQISAPRCFCTTCLYCLYLYLYLPAHVQLLNASSLQILALLLHFVFIFLFKIQVLFSFLWAHLQIS